MTIHIRNAEVDLLARKLAARRNTTVTKVMLSALQREWAADGAPVRHEASRQAAIDAILAQAAMLPILDTRTDDDILGYDENGLPS